MYPRQAVGRPYLVSIGAMQGTPVLFVPFVPELGTVLFNVGKEGPAEVVGELEYVPFEPEFVPDPVAVPVLADVGMSQGFWAFPG